ncbi:MAG TPA: nitrous oxide-stimulated promoter family protein [Planctomycetes bacterium]|nr:nitrous oxide-stimulated promoter family protein [Planctomycetota bacterium]
MGKRNSDAPRLSREKKTVAAMIRIYCRAHHRPDGALCADCRSLHRYAMERVDRCVFGADKPTCASCPIHCYRRQMRERIREVMRFAGPRMLLRHPWLAIRHMLDDRKPAPQRPKKAAD